MKKKSLALALVMLLALLLSACGARTSDAMANTAPSYGYKAEMDTVTDSMMEAPSSSI